MNDGMYLQPRQFNKCGNVSSPLIVPAAPWECRLVNLIKGVKQKNSYPSSKFLQASNAGIDAGEEAYLDKNPGLIAL
jgi:hypothetical protein